MTNGKGIVRTVFLAGSKLYITPSLILLLIIPFSGLRATPQGGAVFFCQNTSNTDGGQSIIDCLSNIPTTGGSIDISNISVPLLSDPFAAVRMPLAVQLGVQVLSFATQITIPSNVVMQGRGKGLSVLKEADGTNLKYGLYVPPGTTNVTLRELSVDFNRVNNPGLQQLAGIYIGAGASQITLQDLDVGNFFGGPDGLTSAPLIAIAFGTGILVESCFLHDNGTPPTHLSDSIYSSGSQNRFIGNRMLNGGDTAIVMENETDSVAANNVIVNVPQGITFDALSPNTKGTGGVISGNDITGVDATNGAAILIQNAPGVSTSAVTVTGNTIHDTVDGQGILVQGSMNVTVSGNTLTNISPTQSITKQGIELIDAQFANVIGNNVNAAGGSGIALLGASNFILVGNQVTNNSQNNPTQLGGIFLGDSSVGATSAGLIIGNRVFGASQAYGIALTGSTTGLYVSDNMLVGNSGLGIVRQDTGNNQVANNLAPENTSVPPNLTGATLSGTATIPNGSGQAISPTMPSGQSGSTQATNDNRVDLKGGTNGSRILNNSGSNALLTWNGGFSFSGDTPVSAAPQLLWTIPLVGNLNYQLPAGAWIPPKAIIVTHISVSLKTGPQQCAASASVTITNGTSSTYVLPIQTNSSDSGALQLSFSAAVPIQVIVSNALGCTTFPADGSIQIEYEMQ